MAEGEEGREGVAMLTARLNRVAEAGRLREPVAHEAAMMRAGATGATLTLLASAPEDRDPGLADALREAVLEAITVTGRETTKKARFDAADRLATRAVALRAALAETKHPALSTAERHLLGVWLDRLAEPAVPRTPARARST